MELNNLDEAHVKKLFDRIQFVQCPICLDVIQNIRELPCRHSFCAVCLETYKEGKDVFACPLCKREVPKRKFLIRDSARDSLCVFMKKLCDDFKGHYGADIVSFFKSFDNRKLKQTSEEIIQPSSEENIIPCTAIQSTNKQTSKRKSVDKKRTKSGSNLRTAKKPKQLEITKNLLSRDNSKTLPGIVATSTVKPELKKKRNKLEKSPRPKLKELHLESTENKTKILKWLHDTKNKFDRLSQTQNAVEVDCRDYTDQQMLSQNSFHESNKNTENDQNCGNEKLEVQHIGKKRARSVENSERECEEFKRHTLECSSPSKFKHYQIQKGKESMEDKLRKKVINIVEDEVLDEFDKEVSGEIKMPNLDLVDTFRAKQVIEDEFLNKLDDKISQNVVKNLSTFSNNKTKTKIKHKNSKFSWKNISKFKRSIKNRMFEEIGYKFAANTETNW
ncbi:hypothetical protein HHI36_006260 [Cryptolaemus montrouzieri]|uniref:RING-type domain-containing protein n=1 Tax=Cryptolaemus montrouzieri TaxID=559131 RepID=A0ABD2NWK9_9CUCU